MIHPISIRDSTEKESEEPKNPNSKELKNIEKC